MVICISPENCAKYNFTHNTNVNLLKKIVTYFFFIYNNTSIPSYQKLPRHQIDEIMVKLMLNTNQSINIKITYIVERMYLITLAK